MTDEERKEHRREQNRQACERRNARAKAPKLGIEGPPKMYEPVANDEERRARHAERERNRRARMGGEYNRLERIRNSKPERKAQIKVASTARYQSKKDEIIRRVTEWQAKNPEKRREYGRTTYQNVISDPVKHAARSKRRRNYESDRMVTDAEFRILKSLRSSLRQALRLYGEGRKTHSVKKLIGCTIEEFVSHIEAQWAPWMSWDNYGRRGMLPENGGKAWVLDHRRPCASYDLTQPDQQKECFSFRNFQPLEYFANLQKRDKLDWQPALEAAVNLQRAVESGEGIEEAAAALDALSDAEEAA